MYNSIFELIGNTPLLKLNNLKKKYNLQCDIFAKLEYFNPLHSFKDRIAIAMIEGAEKDGLLLPGGTIIEPTSGNTGIGLAYIGIQKGYKVIITMPDNMSIEREKILKTLGATVYRTPQSEGIKGSFKLAYELKEQIPNSYVPMQFSNIYNKKTHYDNTAKELIFDMEGLPIDFFISGIGTGGTISGVGEALKAYNSNTKIVAVEPKDCAIISGGPLGLHGIQGIGPSFIPELLNVYIIDFAIPVETEAAYNMAREIASLEGILCGMSSGATLLAALELSKQYKNANMIVIIADTGERYMSTDLFNV